ncbi:MAG TPA: hypothetical protein VGY77_03030 [Gemmataceae bacterium]|nr:hypothetical protein [Gemmataceae bacterium]
MIGGQEYLEEADRYSEEALYEEPWNPPFQGTKGSLLIEMGQPEVGIPMVQKALEFNTDPRSKAFNACYLALGELRRDNREESNRYWQFARAFDPSCLLLDRVEHEFKNAL